MSKTKEQGIGKGPSKIPSHQNPSGQDRIWYSMWKDNSPELRKRAILWRKQRPRGGRRPKHLGVTRIKADDSMKKVAQRRVLERYPNMKLLGSYFLYKDGMYYWYEVILADPSHPRIIKDKELRKRILPSMA